jgi:hypothetical protein
VSEGRAESKSWPIHKGLLPVACGNGEGLGWYA